MPKYSKAFTLIELVVVIALIGLLSGGLLIQLKPESKIEEATYRKAEYELGEIANAINYYLLDYGEFPDDVWRNIPSGLEEYLPGGVNWPEGPYPGSVYDYDNWEDETCWNGETGIIQITLREVDDFQGHDDYTLYFVIRGKGIPHCSNSSTKGQCINCGNWQPTFE